MRPAPDSDMLDKFERVVNCVLLPSHKRFMVTIEALGQDCPALLDRCLQMGVSIYGSIPPTPSTPHPTQDTLHANTRKSTYTQRNATPRHATPRHATQHNLSPSPVR